ncbi:MAG: immune inhibitor A, partial [Dehalococcoidia bacterium]|nr:immune inhibitor A [Dehalococcoidia bacterium]
SVQIVDEAPNIPVPPDRDLFEVAQRLRTGGVPIPRAVNPVSPEYTVGHQETFWLTDLQGSRYFTTTATLRYVTPRSYTYLEDGQDVSLADLQRSAQEFEDHIFPTVTKYYGSNWRPGIDNDPHLSIVNARIPAVAGFFSASDQYPKAINPFSNQRKAIYMNLAVARPGSTAYNAILAHEFQHSLYWDVNPYSEAWINEGAAELASVLAGYQSNFPNAFLNRPDTQLDTWPEEPSESAPSYGAALLFLKYLAQHYGGYEALKEIIASPGRGQQSITSYLTAKGYGVDFDGVFKDWVIANYLNQPGEGRYSYLQDRTSAKGKPIGRFGEYQETVHQYAADYLELGFDSGDVLLQFEGQPEVKLIPDQPHSGRAQWWANRGDSIDTTLTREFDLQGLQKATLRFWTWYNIENTWDYAYVETSVDGGRTWNILAGQHTTTENPLGNGFGPGYTGISGRGKEPIWIEDSIDLSPFAGKKMLLRFEYITDEAVNDVGFALDDISIPELGFVDGAEENRDWEARGFFRTSNSLRERFTLQIIKIGQDTVVEDVPVDEEGRARLELRGFGKGLQKAVLVVSAHTPVTTEIAHFRLVLSPLGS